MKAFTKLYDGDRGRLLAAANQLDLEAKTWAEGFAIILADGSEVWGNPEYEWAHVRCARLRIDAAFLREIADRKPHAETLPIT